MSPSAPCAHGSSRSEAATRAAVQVRREHPPQTPPLLDSPAENVVLTAGFRSGQLSQEGLCLQGESSSHLDTQHHQPCTSVSADDFWVRGFLASSGSRHSGSVLNCCSWPSVLKAQTRVVSTTNWVPNKRRPSTITSSLLPSPAATAGSTKSRSRNNTDLLLHGRLRPATLSKAHPLFPRTPARAHAARWW